MKTQMVEILIHISQAEEGVFSGEYILRALDADGTLLHEAHVMLTDLDATTAIMPGWSRSRQRWNDCTANWATARRGICCG